MRSLPIVRVLSVLWRMLNLRRRFVFVSLVFASFVSGILEMSGMILIFGFIGGLKVDPTTGERSGKLAKLLYVFTERLLSNQEYVLLAGGLVLGVLALKNITSTAVQFGLNRFLMKLNQRVSEGLFRGFLLSPYEFHAAEGASSASRQVTKIFEVFSRAFTSVAQILSDGTMLLMVTVLLVVINPWLTMGAAFLFLGAGVGLYRGIQRSLTQMGRDQQKERERAARFLDDGMQGLIEARLRDSRLFLMRGYSRSLGRTGVMRRRLTALQRMPRSFNEMLLALLIVGSVFFLTYSGGVIEDALPTLGIFGFAGLRMTSAMTRVNASFQRLKKGAEEFEAKYQTVVELAPGVFGEDNNLVPSYLAEEEPLPPGVDGRLNESLEAENVIYSYPGSESPAVNGVNLQIPRGAFVSFCGPSGGGKSTLVMLLMGFLQPQSGRVTCDGWSIAKHIRSLHANIGYVGQRMYLANRSIRQNVGLGIHHEEIDDERVWKALKLAAADDFVDRLPGKLQHNLHEGGSNLSGGQRQRLIIARALYGDPDIVVFDEATAALDNTTEREITEAIQRLSGQKTIICVAHRLSTIRNSDVIHVVVDGKIEASGSYAELLETSTTFQELARTGSSS